MREDGIQSSSEEKLAFIGGVIPSMQLREEMRAVHHVVVLIAKSNRITEGMKRLEKEKL